MAFVCMLAAWLGAAWWLGALAVSRMLDGDAVFTYTANQRDYSAAYQLARDRLDCLMRGGMGMIVVSTFIRVVTQGTVAPSQVAGSSIAALALLGAVFHVEHFALFYRHPRRWHALLLLMSVANVVTTSAAFIDASTFGATANRWAIILSCSALIGAVSGSVALVPLHDTLPSPEHAQILARITSHWTLLLGCAATILAVAGWEYAHAVWNSHQLVALAWISVTAAPLGSIIALRVLATLRLEAALLAMPILGMPGRELRARQANENAATRAVWRLGSASALITVVAAGIAVAVTLTPGRAAPRPRAIAPSVTYSPTPIITPAPAQSAFALPQKVNGLTITLSGGPLVVGQNTLHLTVTNAQGQLIPDATIILVSNTLGQHNRSMTTQTKRDAASNPPSFTGTIDLSQAGVWQIVAIVATANQSVSATAVFLVSVGG